MYTIEIKSRRKWVPTDSRADTREALADDLRTWAIFYPADRIRIVSA